MTDSAAQKLAHTKSVIRLKRVYEAAARGDGERFLVDRLWPRGLRKADVPLDGWLKEAGPSAELRKWFSHDPQKWAVFQRKYFDELKLAPEAWEPILDAAKRGTVTLLYSSHETEHNNAVALKKFLESTPAAKKKAAPKDKPATGE